jgi:hypothetical protein
MLSITENAHGVRLAKPLAQIPLTPAFLLANSLGQVDQFFFESGSIAAHDH